MTEFPTRSQIKIGILVKVREKNRDRVEEFEGKIKEILTNHDTHPYGIKVELDSGKTGRVIEILDGSVSTIQSNQELPSDEDHKTEFKSTFRLDLNRLEKGDGKKVQNKEVEKEIPVTISAMANSEGGILLIGVDDDGKILGLENDYDLLQNPNDDKFQRMIWQSIQNSIQNMAYVSKLKLSLIQKESKKICLIEIPPSDEPIFLHENNTQESYVRVGPKSEKFGPADFMKYSKTRFKE
jgi:uncharacterized repeat protein (TIGR03833 family)